MGTMKDQPLIYGSIIAVGIIAAVICVGLVTGFSVAKPFISVDPIGDKNMGDQFTISGTTSLPAGTEILVEVYPSVYEDQMGTGSGEFSGATGTITISNSTSRASTWSFSLDTATFRPMEYLVNVSSLKGNTSKGDYTKGDIFGSTRFTLSPASGTAVTVGASRLSDNAAPGGILIDAIRDTTAGDPLVVTGRTNLTAGTDLIVKVISSSMDSARIASDYQNPEIAAVTKVVKGSGSGNRFSVSLDTGHLPAAEHIVVVSDVKGDAAGSDSRPGSFTGTAMFNIIAGATGTGKSGNDAGQYIKIDPVADTTTGDLLIVTGSTNLPAGTTLMVDIGSPGVGSGSSTVVSTGTGEVNRYSIPFDTSILEPGTQKITVNNMMGDVSKGDYRPGTVNGTASFMLKGTYLGADTPVQPTITKDDYIRLNPIGDRSVGDQFLITGTTSLPAGTTLIWEVMPDTGTPPTGLDLNATGIMANNPVTKGDGISNRVSLAADMTGFAPGKWVAFVGIMKGEPNSGSLEIGELTGSAYFTLK
jgi:hypothetical protein